MFSAEDQQIGICLLKSNLEEIENDLVVQHSALPTLNAENKIKYNETMTALRALRSMNSEIEKLKQENVHLTAKRVQMKRQCEELLKDLKTARANRDELANSLKQEDREMDLQIRQYENSLQEKADRFRRTSGYYDKAEVSRELNTVNSEIGVLETEFTQRQNIVDELKKQAKGIHPEVPENLLDICGKQELDEKVKALTAKLEALSKKRKATLTSVTGASWCDVS